MDTRTLILKAKEGDQKAFATLVGQARLTAWNVCLRICGNHHDAEDALQSALTLAWRNMGKFRGEAGFSTWFYRIASNAALALVRSRKEASSLDAHAEDHGEVQLMDTTSSFEDRLAHHDQLSQALSMISDANREALILQEVAGFSLAEIAQHQNTSLSAVKGRVFRARKDVAAILAEMDL